MIPRFCIPMIVLTSLLAATTTEAHGVRSAAAGTGKVRFTYDDGSPVARGHITVYDKTGKEIASETADGDGVFDYSSFESVAKISVGDIHGHHAEYVVGRTPDSPSSDDRGMYVLVAVLILLVVAAAFRFGNIGQLKNICLVV